MILEYFLRLFLDMLYIISNSRSQESNTANSVQIRAKTRKIWMIEENCIKKNQSVSFA